MILIENIAYCLPTLDKNKKKNPQKDKQLKCITDKKTHKDLEKKKGKKRRQLTRKTRNKKYIDMYRKKS